MKEKWSKGTYIVPLQNKLLSRNGFVTAYKPYQIISSTPSLPFIIDDNGNKVNFVTTHEESEVYHGIRWFETKEEAEEFAKTLAEPVRDEYTLDMHEEMKQTLKQAVHCKTAEEWDFVTKKLGYKWINAKWNNYKFDSVITLHAKGCSGIGDEDYQILSFQEWCDLNGYKMEKEVKFEVGKWYKNSSKNSQKNTFGKFLNLRNNEKEFWMSECIYKGKFTNTQGWLDYSSETVEIDIKEIQQYLPDGHPDKIKSNDFKVGDWVVVVESKSRFPDINRAIGYIFQIRGDYSYYEDFMNGFDKAIDGNNKYCINYNKSNIRHATPEEINQHLISIGQIPAGEPLNTGIEPNKDGMFKYKQTMPGASWSGGTIDNHLDVMIQSKTQSEIEFNYLPEPK